MNLVGKNPPVRVLARKVCHGSRGSLYLNYPKRSLFRAIVWGSLVVALSMQYLIPPTLEFLGLTDARGWLIFGLLAHQFGSILFALTLLAGFVGASIWWREAKIPAPEFREGEKL